MASRSTKSAVSTKRKRSSSQKPPAQILTVDIGGSKIKVLVTGETQPRKYRSGKWLTPGKMVKIVRELAEGWDYEAISIGYPGLVGDHGPSSEPGSLGGGWVGFPFSSAFDLPVRIINDAAMQALGSYEGGRMLFLGLGTGLGSAMVTEHTILTLELGELPYEGGKLLGKVVGDQGLKLLGKIKWRNAVVDIVPALMKAFLADSVVLGGGNAKKLKELPPGVRLGHNLTAFLGGFRLWNLSDSKIVAADYSAYYAHQSPGE
jgi:polyphosphate glucokinase